jgi:hypothetical protein
MSDENHPYNAEERREAINAILDCTKYWPSPREHTVFKGLLAEIERLRAEVAALKAQSEPLKAEPRRKVVQLIVLRQAGQTYNELYALADDGTIWQRYEPNGWSQSLDIPQPEQEAKR